MGLFRKSKEGKSIIREYIEGIIRYVIIIGLFMVIVEFVRSKGIEDFYILIFFLVWQFIRSVQLEIEIKKNKK